MQSEPLLQLFIPNATCFERSHCGGLPGVDVVSLLEFAGSHMVVEWTEALELLVESWALTFALSDQPQCSFAIILG